MFKKSISLFLVLFSLLLLPPFFQLLYEDVESPYFHFLLYLSSFSLLSLAFVSKIKAKKTFYICSVNVLVFILFIIFSEFLFYVLNEFSSSNLKYTNTDLNSEKNAEIAQPDSVLGYKMKKLCKIQSVLKNGDDTIYSSLYSSNEEGLRTTLFDSTKTKSAWFFGCSFTFGAGLNDNESLPYLVAQQTNYNTKNFAFGGYGPQHALLLLSQQKNNHSTKIVYVYIDAHIRRVNGFFSIVNSYGKNFQYPEFVNDSLIMHASFKEKSPFLSRLYHLLQHHQGMEYFTVDLPFFIRQKHIELCAKTIEKTALLAKKSTGSSMILVIYPGSKNHNQLLASMNLENISVVDYSAWCEKGDERYFFKNDGHPNAQLNALLSKRLAKEFQ